MVHMIEFWDYLVQFLVCAAGCAGAAVLLIKSRRQPYFLLACFFGTYGLGTFIRSATTPLMPLVAFFMMKRTAPL